MSDMKRTLDQIDKELWVMTRKLTGMQIPYNPPPKNLNTMKENNEKGYALLMKYLETQAEYEDMLKNGEENRS